MIYKYPKFKVINIQIRQNLILKRQTQFQNSESKRIKIFTINQKCENLCLRDKPYSRE